MKTVFKINNISISGLELIKILYDCCNDILTKQGSPAKLKIDSQRLSIQLSSPEDWLKYMKIIYANAEKGKYNSRQSPDFESSSICVTSGAQPVELIGAYNRKVKFPTGHISPYSIITI